MGSLGPRERPGGEPQITRGKGRLQAWRPGLRSRVACVLALVALTWDRANPAWGQTADITAGSASITAAEVREIVAALADDSLEGREAGTPGAERAAAYIAAELARLGLRAPEGGYLQELKMPGVRGSVHGHEEQPWQGRKRTANVVAILDGTDPELRDEAIVIGAHYDHLGWGGEGSLARGVRAIHNGADDNASGVAGLLELAERFVVDSPRRTLVFVAFGAEEAGNLGSLAYVHDPAWPLESTLAMINLDMIGRSRGRVTVYGTGTSSAWPPLLDQALAAADSTVAAAVATDAAHADADATAAAQDLAADAAADAAAAAAQDSAAADAAIDAAAETLIVTRIPDGFGPSDHASFYGARIPVLAFFTGAHEDYHRPSDDVERLDAEGEARVLELVAAVLDGVAGSDVELTPTEAPITQPTPVAFRVALGTLPDYAFEGPGVRLSAVRPGSPADKAGVRAGDVLLRLRGREVGDVYGYTAILADLEPNVPVELVVARGGERQVVTVTPEPR